MLLYKLVEHIVTIALTHTTFITGWWKHTMGIIIDRVSLLETARGSEMFIHVEIIQVFVCIYW